MSKYTNIESVKNYVEIARRRLIELGFTELKEARILVEWNTRAYNRLGQCCPRRDYYGKHYFILNFIINQIRTSQKIRLTERTGLQSIGDVNLIPEDGVLACTIVLLPT